VLSEIEQEMANKLRMKLMEIERTVNTYHDELVQGRFRPRRGERWERTIEKHMVTAASLLGKSNAQLLNGFFELIRINRLAKEAKIVGEDIGRPSEIT
jgi:hypothetical protein